MMAAYAAIAGRIVFLGLERIFVKKLCEHGNTMSATIIFMGLGWIYFLPLLFFTDVKIHPYLWMIALNAGVYVLAFIYYVQALAEGEASLVSPLYNFNIAFLLGLSGIFLQEKITFLKIGGVVLLIYGMSFLNRRQNFFVSLKAVLTDTACRKMIFCSLLVAFGRIVDGFIVRDTPPVLYGFTISLFVSFIFFIYALITGKLSITIALFKKAPLLSIASGAVNAASYILMLAAFTAVDVSVVEPASMLSVIVTIGFARYVFKERIQSRLIGAIIMLIGAWLVFM